jgi:hypothetical protein
MLGAPIVLVASAVTALSSAFVSSTDWPDLKAEVFAAMPLSRSTRVEFRIVNDGAAPIDVSRLLSGDRRSDRGSVAGVRLTAEPGGPIALLRDSRGRCECSRGVREVLPRWHLDFRADFASLRAGVLVLRVEIPHFPPIRLRMKDPG